MPHLIKTKYSVFRLKKKKKKERHRILFNFGESNILLFFFAEWIVFYFITCSRRKKNLITIRFVSYIISFPSDEHSRWSNTSLIIFLVHFFNINFSISIYLLKLKIYFLFYGININKIIIKKCYKKHKDVLDNPTRHSGEICWDIQGFY